MSAENEVQKLIATYIECWNARDYDGMADMFAEPVTYIVSSASGKSNQIFRAGRSGASVLSILQEGERSGNPAAPFQTVAGIAANDTCDPQIAYAIRPKAAG
ncbi:nuclear transport factor 2 family protein [Litoreibacter albidus]|uniref:hypothetical protein n=1 Tax=Litoreibacter albidus TaxID=670155 RepID=UPI003735EAB9